MNILIVGGAGYLGGALTDILINTKHKVKVYDSLMYEQSYFKPVDFIFGDVRDRKKLLPHLKWADAVVWLAAIVGDSACALNPDISTEINDKSVEWLANNYDGRIIFMATCSVYGARDGELTEDSPTNPLSVYAVTKFAAESYLKDKNAIIFRLGTLFGLGDRFSRIRLDLVVNTLTVRAYFDGKLKVFGGEQYRPLLHVRDAAQAIADNLETKHVGIFNLHKENTKIVDLAEDVRKHFPGLVIDKTEMKFEDSRNYRVRSDKAKQVFNFNPVFVVEDGIRELKKLFDERRVKDINNPNYTNQGHLAMFNTHTLIV